MTETSGFFQTNEAVKRTYKSQQMADFIASFLSNGVRALGTNLQVTCDGTDRVAHVSAGRAVIEGCWYSSDEEVTFTLDEADATYGRIDRIVLRLDKGSTEISAVKLAVLKGTPASTPAPVDLTREGDIYEISLAQILVPAGSSTVPAENVTDEREDTEVCGIMHSSNQEDALDIWVDERETDFNSWYQSVQNTALDRKSLLKREIIFGKHFSY
ncbi:hypothetical protein [Methanococcus maripaludis]|uniref:Uncharacterized protein n=1 Tax=Methanococcus maripaludis TaxID=39152 RepID=A0A8T4H2M7_METMI|nr:hypothetical protein [Methanococcus maripaludis]MBM7408771.1 hypothetical protein [Methanococcus maripaludis]MBP2219060.1 hypothetical protein [Methanococcus maripaludis]